MDEPPEISAADLALLRLVPEHATRMTNAANELMSIVAGYNDRQAGILTALEAISDKQGAVKHSVDHLLPAVITEAVAPIRDGLNKARDLIPTMIAEAVTQLRDELIKTRAEIMGRIDRLQNTVELVREDGRVNWATADTAMNRTKSYRDEIENMALTMAAMERRYHRLMAMVEELREQSGKKPEA